MRKNIVLSAALCVLLLLGGCGQRAAGSAPAAMPWPSHAPEATPFVRAREEAGLRHLEETAREQPTESSWEETMARIYTRREVNRRKTSFLIFAGIYDFLGVVAGIIVIIACAVLLTALFNWVVRDGRESFASLWNIFQVALIVPK